MSLYTKLSTDMKAAMKARDAKRRDALRLLLSDLQTLLIDVEGADLEEKSANLGEQGEINFLTTQAKRRRESIESYESAGRDDLAEQEKFELGIIEAYLPQQLSREEAEEIIRGIIEDVGATSRKQLGQVMGKAMARLKGRFPGGEVKGIVASLLD